MARPTGLGVAAGLLQSEYEYPVQVSLPISLKGGDLGTFTTRLTQLQAEKLLYDLHSVVQTLRGHNRKPTWRERIRARLRRR